MKEMDFMRKGAKGHRPTVTVTSFFRNSKHTF